MRIGLPKSCVIAETAARTRIFISFLLLTNERYGINHCNDGDVELIVGDDGSLAAKPRAPAQVSQTENT